MGKVKKKEHEKLSAANINHVIELLNQKKPITKKEACSILNITYNTTRLARIIEEHEEHEAFVASRKAANRGKRATNTEISQVVTDYLTGESISEIAKSLFRSPGFVKSIVEKVGVPQRPTGEDKAKFDFIPDSCISETFEPGEIVWSAKYHRTAVIRKEWRNMDYEDMYSSKCYRIAVIEPVDSSDSPFPYVQTGGFNAYALAYDLGKLSHLKQYGISLENL